MKRIYATLLALGMTLSLAACGASGNGDTSASAPNTPPAQEQETQSPSSTPDTGNTPDTPAVGDAAASNPETPSAGESSILIAYFGVPETDGTDTVANASRVATEEGVVGNTQFIAQAIQQAVDGDLFAIETVQEYPGTHDPLLEFAYNELREDARPELATQIENLDQYDVIFLGYPNWNSDLPMPLYTFLESYDFAGKTIVPFVTHGGSGFSRTISTIQSLQPDATVLEDGFSVSRNNVANAAQDAMDWASSLNLA